MQMTVILIELLIIGGELGLLLAGAYYVYFDVRIRQFSVGNEASALIALGLALYPLGILWSRVCDWLLSPLDRKLKKKVFGKNEQYHSELALVLRLSEKLAEGLAQVRSQYRIARATSVSAALGVVIVVSAEESLLHLSRGGKIFTLVLLLLGSLSSLFAWYHLRLHYLMYVRNASRALPGNAS